ncbi:MAG: amidohydrolase family protein [Candidatus Thorarchaeota archaeon]
MVIIDFHVHAQKLETLLTDNREFLEKEKIITSMDEAGIDYSVLSVVAKKGEIKKTRMVNDQLSALCSDEKRFFGFGSIHPLDGKSALEEMDRCVKELGLQGFKFHPVIQDFDVGDPSLIKIFQKAAKLDVPIIIDSCDPRDATQNTKFFNLASTCPETKICFAHVGLHRFMDYFIFGYLKDNPYFKMKIYFDLTSICSTFKDSPFHEQVRWITEKIGSDYLLFGSDFPGNSQKESLQDIIDFGYPKEWISRILGENAMKLLNF